MILSCENVSIAYDRELAVDGLSFNLDNGDYLCVVGENGSGKSTLVKAILGLLKPVSGRIRLYGVARTEIGYMPQQTLAQRDFPASVFEVILSGCLNRRGMKPFYTKKERDRARKNAARLGMEDSLRSSYRDLSGGQQQRVLLARALCATERVLVLDEPVAGLDPVAASELYGVIDEMNREQGITVIMVSHDVRNAVSHAGKVLHLSKHPLFFGDTEDYLSSDLWSRMTGGKDSA